MLRVAAVLIAAYVAYGVLMTAIHPRLLYPFADVPLSDPRFARAEVPVPDAAPLAVAVAPSPHPGAPVVLFFMGNVGTLAYHLPVLEPHLGAGRTVIAMTYRGGGGEAGRPSEGRLKADALALYDALPQLGGGAAGPVFVHGYSLGAGLALHVAANRSVKGVILDAPFARACDLMRRASGLPACHMPFVQTWDNLALAGRIRAPVLIQHGGDDRVIPPSEGQRLADAMTSAGATVAFEELEGGTHDNLSALPPWASNVARFIAGNSGP